MSKLATTVIAVVVFIAGGVLGFGVSRELAQAQLTAYEMADVDHFSTYVMIQRFEGTPQAYEAALNDLLAALDQRERSGSPFAPERILFVDRALTYTRLALIATSRGDAEAAAKYRSSAEALCPKVEWKTCSTDELAKLVQRLDETSMWNPKHVGGDQAANQRLERP